MPFFNHKPECCFEKQKMPVIRQAFNKLNFNTKPGYQPQLMRLHP